MTSKLFFNLIADLIRKAKDKHQKSITDSIIDVSKAALETRATVLLMRFFGRTSYSHDTLPLTSQIVADIIRICEEYDDYYFYRVLVCRLDSMVNMTKLISNCDIFSIHNVEEEIESFVALNDNYDATNIRILPLIEGIRVNKSKFFDDEKPHFDHEADYWTDDLNSHLEKLYYQDQTLFDNIDVDNVMIVPQKTVTEKDTIDIAYSPLSNSKITEILSYNDNIQRQDEKGNVFRYFGDVDVLQKDMIRDRFIASLRNSASISADIMVSVEMLGTHDLCLTDDNKCNKHYSNLFYNDYDLPSLVIPPSLWENRENSLYLFLRNGKGAGIQSKYTKFRFVGKYGKCDEDLAIEKRKLRMFHIPGIGRIVLMICADFLDTDYRKFVASVLKATLIICPSFSTGTREFDKRISSLSEYETTCVWLNCCSAIAEHEHVPDYIGLVSTPIVCEEGNVTRIKPECGGNCQLGCLFKISIPKNAVGDQLHEDIKATVTHIVEKKKEGDKK